MSNDEFGDFLNQKYQHGCGNYNQGSSNPYSARNKVIDDDLIKSLTEQVDKYTDEIVQKRKGKHQPKFTDEEFNKTCEELGLVEDK